MALSGCIVAVDTGGTQGGSQPYGTAGTPQAEPQAAPWPSAPEPQGQPYGSPPPYSAPSGGRDYTAMPVQPPPASGPGIQVIAGTYGANCRAPYGNKTQHLAASCNGRAACSYTIDYQVIGDPAVGCSKDYVAEYRCGSNPEVRRATASPEAGFRKNIELSCVGTQTVQPPPSPPVCDVAGTWRHGGGGETWTFTGQGGGRYAAQEKGFGNAAGPAVLSGNKLRIDYKTQDGRTTGFYEFTISPDCTKGEGSWQDSRPAGGSASMVRVSAATPPTPATPAGLTNLALRKQASQSSTGYGGDAGRAVDGKTDGNYSANSVSHTNNQPHQWWQVDLGAVYPIQSVRIWNRTDCCAERLSRFYVFVSDTPLPAGNVQASQNHPGVGSFFYDRTAGRTTDIPVNRNGRYVRVQLTGADYLQLAEVEVLGRAAAAGTPTTPPAGTVSVPLNQTVGLRSINYQTMYLRHRNGMADLTPLSSDQDRSDATFRIVPGLADNRMISFESVNPPGHFLRHQGGRVKLHPRAGDQLFLDDATYKVVPGLADAAWVSFESKNYPGHYLRHRGFQFFVERGTDDLFRKDSTFRFEARTTGAQPTTTLPAGGWRGVGTGDCPGRDVASSTGPNPDPGKCTAAFAGFTAVCWANNCTYKNVPTAQCTGGANPGRMYTCQPQASTPPPAVPAGAITWDFETGNLQGWTKTGTAFDAQPTYGDNPTARNRGQASKHQGNYWIGTYEKRPRQADPAGQVQGDEPQGTLTSQPFPVQRPAITFLIGGGCDVNAVRAELVVDGQVVHRATGKCSETMERVRWDVSRYQGKSAQIRLVDQSGGAWGHLNFDDVHFE
jgi:hypothetical protein